MLSLEFLASPVIPASAGKERAQTVLQLLKGTYVGPKFWLLFEHIGIGSHFVEWPLNAEHQVLYYMIKHLEVVNDGPERSIKDVTDMQI